MNKKKLKQLRKRIRPLQVEWLKSLLKKEEADKVTIENVSSFYQKILTTLDRGNLTCPLCQINGS